MSDHVLTAALRGLREMVIATGDSKCRDCHACQLDVILEALNAAIAAARSCDKCQSTYSCKVQAPASDTESASESESEDDDADQPITAGANVVCFAAPVQSKASQDDEDEDTESEDEDDESESDDNECDK